MIELAIVGAKNSGKTTVIEGLIGYLVDNGCHVGTIKHTSHSHRFDTQGKDSYRHRQTGSMVTAAVSNEEIAIFAQPGVIDTAKLRRMTGQQIDIWLIEGDRRSNLPKILVTRELSEISDDLPNNIVATIGKEKLADVAAHFEEGDYKGLGEFVRRTMLDKETDVHR
jgi:molybdopterin-guanine dinucleotide biosynthesis protein B